MKPKSEVSKGILTESKSNKMNALEVPKSNKMNQTPAKKTAVHPPTQTKTHPRRPENVRDLNRFSFGAIQIIPDNHKTVLVLR